VQHPHSPSCEGRCSQPTGGVLCNVQKEQIASFGTQAPPLVRPPELPGPQTRGWPVRAGTRLRESSHEDQLSVRRHRHTRRRSCPTARPCTAGELCTTLNQTYCTIIDCVRLFRVWSGETLRANRHTISIVVGLPFSTLEPRAVYSHPPKTTLFASQLLTGLQGRYFAIWQLTTLQHSMIDSNIATWHTMLASQACHARVSCHYNLRYGKNVRAGDTVLTVIVSEARRLQVLHRSFIFS
jgi:hypothetical protein